MRKQDRIAREQQSGAPQPPEGQQQPEPRAGEEVKGGASTDRPTRPPRESGKLPLPD
jgi:hypothetical protein